MSQSSAIPRTFRTLGGIVGVVEVVLGTLAIFVALRYGGRRSVAVILVMASLLLAYAALRFWRRYEEHPDRGRRDVNRDEYRSRELLQDASAEAREIDQPAFLSRPAGAPVYHGFPLIEESRTPDGWIFGAITEFVDPEGATFGDAYVQAPDGTRAGLVWEVGDGAFAEISPPTSDRWGVYAVWLGKPIRTVEDFVTAFQAQLPLLQQAWQRSRSPRDA